MKLSRLTFAGFVVAAIGVGATWAALQTRSLQPEPLAEFAPSGALLSIETPDFRALLRAWSNSPEEKRWLSSGNYAGFSRSRLFDRLGQAQSEFTTTAGVAPDMQFLQQVAGTESLLAWYDIGNLQFLYITRLPAGAAERTPLLQLRGRFEQRSAAGIPFYIRTASDTENDGPSRTVAFAIKGDYLLLATGEDLLAGALALMQKPGDRTLLHDAWYSSTDSASDSKPAELRLSLNLAALVRSPYFRSYWVQQNITDTAQYMAARSDLYRTSDSIREERTLIPVKPEDSPATTDLAPVLAYLPSGVGVYRAQAQPKVDAVVAELDDKLLTRSSAHIGDAHIAPIADLTITATGDASDLDERIDTPVAVRTSHRAILAPLHSLLASASPTAVISFSTATQSSPVGRDTVFLPIHSAVAVASDTAWNSSALERALDAVLLPELSVAADKLSWTEQADPSHSISLSGPQHLVFAVQGKILVLASDEATLQQLIAAHESASLTTREASIVAGFNHSGERVAYVRLTQLLDHNAEPAPSDQESAPAFFSANLASLSDTFQDLGTETFIQSTAADHTVHQTVLYQWKR